MLKVHKLYTQSEDDFPVFVRFDEIIRIELTEREEDANNGWDWTGATIYTYDNGVYSTGILGILELKEKFKLDLGY